MAFSPRALRDAAIALGTSVGATLLYPGVLLRGESFFERDVHLDWYPRLEALARCLQEGAWPLWDTSIGFGQPLLADPGAQVAYPMTWLVLAVPRPVAYTILVLFHLVVAALGTQRLARRLGAGPIGAPVAAALFVLSGPVQSSVNLWHHLSGLAWMPWVLLGVDRAVRVPGLRATAALVLVAGVQVLAGSADVCAMTLALAAGWVLVRMLRSAPHRRRSMPVAQTLLAAALLVALTTAVLWMPALELLERSPRQELPADVRTAWSLPPAGLWRLVTPLDPVRVTFEPETWRRLYDRAEPPFLWSLYLGCPALALAAAAFVPRRFRLEAVALGLGAVVALALALGPHAPFYPLATAVAPPLKVFRYPTKALLAGSLLVSLLAGIGLGALARGRLRSRAAAGLAIALAVVGLLAALAPSRFGGAGVAQGVAVASVAGGLFWLLAGWGRVAPRVAAVAIAAFAVLDLLAAHVGLNATAPAALIFEPPPAVARVDRSAHRRLYVYDYHSLPGTAERQLGRAAPYAVGEAPPGWGREQFRAAALRLYLVPPSAGLFGIEGSYDLDIRGLYPRFLNDLTFFLRHVEGTSVHTRLLRLGAVGTVLSLHDQGLEDLPLDGTLPSLLPEAIRVRRVPESLPRSWVVGGVRFAERRRALEILSGPVFDPGREVVLAGAGEDRPPPAGFRGASHVRRLAPDHMTLDVEASSSGFVVLADAFDPGWRAAVDGRPATVRRANVAFRAVAVPAGRHVVEMSYRPRGAVWGLILSGVGLLGVLGVALIERARRERRGRGR
jgi:hypothetical protein